jgi:hypothetical protein
VGISVFLDIEERNGGLLIAVTGPQLPRAERPVSWTEGKHLLVPEGTVTDPAAVAAMAHAVEDGTGLDVKGRIAAQQKYGSLLFEAAFGQELWQQLLAAASGHPCLELGVRGIATQDQADLQALRWEALYDGKAFVAAQGAAGGSVSVSITRLVGTATGTAKEIDCIPRVLFVIGSRLTHQDMRPGAEFMGIMRRLERGGGLIHPKILDEATLESLRHETHSFRPDILHLIGHGRRGLDNQVQLGLHREAADDDGFVTARQLLGAISDGDRTPAIVILSACKTAASQVDASPHVNTMPFAAQLVAGGVPVVVAMAGDIQDTACRVFTRALTDAIGNGVPLGKAVVSGRRAAFYDRVYDSADWIMPTVFVADGDLMGIRLFNTRKAEAARARIQDLGMHLAQDTSVFCGREEFFPAMDLLLDGVSDAPHALVASTPGKDKHYGGTRLLRELGARAVRTGVVPILLGPYDHDPPTSLAGLSGLAGKLSTAVSDTCDALHVDRTSSRLEAVGDGVKPRDLADAIRADLDQVILALDPDDPVRSRPPGLPQVVLLCHRVDTWQAAFDGLLDMLGPRGLRGSGRRIPVVMTGAGIDALEQGRDGSRKIPCSAVFLTFGRLPTAEDKDLLAYQWWLLNPPHGTPAYALRRNASPLWREWFRHSLENDPVYPGARLYKTAEIDKGYFISDSDEDLLATYVQAVP